MKCLALFFVLCLGCTPSHLERAKVHRRTALDAQAAGDVETTRGAMQASIEAAQASLDAKEGAAAQAWVIRAWAHLALGESDSARTALREARTLHRGGAPAWQQRILVAAHCQIASEEQWYHYQALCQDHLLHTEVRDGLQPFAAEGIANADARRKPGYTQLVEYGHPLFQRLFKASRRDPMSADLLAILGARLSRFCRDENFTQNIKGWRQFRGDLFAAAQGMGSFTTDDRRRSFERDQARALKVPLCPRVTPALPPAAPSSVGNDSAG